MRKIFSVLLLTIFMAGNLNAFEKEMVLPHNYDDCIYTANLQQTLALLAGFSSADAYEMGNNAYQNCVDQVDIKAATYWQNN